jgi:hypothetical protein
VADLLGIVLCDQPFWGFAPMTLNILPTCSGVSSTVPGLKTSLDDFRVDTLCVGLLLGLTFILFGGFEELVMACYTFQYVAICLPANAKSALRCPLV